ncbi:putative phosphoglycerate mutase family protein [Enhygromyxa salina]|uniref:phosphoglycerate mutase (2,3-diphosphoglycerate-dependent) n=1 Tax=Enhygromyxa salina TaxID=215803 RepID=A0A0C1ZU39_9BACT|nr:histidine phosphatase family protein [Enhygromyxa salina]KIG14573.1 putative phosphoglycerate mutase family protein [Enhygromyxa salina]
MQELVLIRHGETVGQSSIRLYGATDVALAPEGEAQVRATAQALIGQRFDAVLTSPLSRAHRSAEVMLSTIDHPKIDIEVVEGFREIDFGAWEGWTWEDVRARDPANHARWASEGPAFRFPAGEVRQEFVARVQAEVGPNIRARFLAGAQRILTVVHKGVIKAITSELLGVPFLELGHLELPLGALARLRGGPDQWALDPTGNNTAMSNEQRGEPQP